MAKKTTKSIASAAPVAAAPSADEPRTGLGETLPEIEAKVKAAMKALIPFFRKDAEANAAFEAAYQFGIVEKRARKLRRKVGKVA